MWILITGTTTTTRNSWTTRTAPTFIWRWGARIWDTETILLPPSLSLVEAAKTTDEEESMDYYKVRFFAASSGRG
jgi:hypothetical protein